VFLLAAGQAAHAKPLDKAVYQAVADRLMNAYNSADYEGIRVDFAQATLDVFPVKDVKEFSEGLMAQYGKIRRFGEPKISAAGEAIFPVWFERGTLELKFNLDGNGKIAGLWFLPHVPDNPVHEKNETGLNLPFKGRWYVLWGGDTEDKNAHHSVTNQRYAFDFVVVDEKGSSFKGLGSSNEDYYAFGKEILAPADGVVTEVIEGVNDNTPGSMNPYSALGNAVIIRHADYEVSVMAHFKQGSIKVKAGDNVKAGQVIGLCGNSGNSSEPHLHYHLQNATVIQDGVGIKCFFKNVIFYKDGGKEKKDAYSPEKGDVVETQ
jgi:hypothetical protein